MKVFLIIGVFLLFFLILVLILFTSKKKMKREMIKITEADNSIDLYLETKKKLLKKSKDLLKDADYLENFEKSLSQELDHIKKHQLFKEYFQQLKERLEDDEEEIENEQELRKTFQDLKDNDSNLYGSIKFFNQSVENYWNISKKFPTNLVRLFCGFQKFEVYEIEKTNRRFF